MFRLILTLFGGDLLVRRWKIFMLLGLLTLLVGVVVLADLVDGVADIASWVFGLMLLLQGLIELVVGATHERARRRFEMLRGLAMVVVACLLLDFPWDNAIATGLLFACAFIFNGLLRIVASLLVRYPNWRSSHLLGWGYLLMAVLLLSDWPLPASMNVSFCTGLALMTAGFVLMRGAWRLQRLPPGSRLAAIELYKKRREPALAAPVPVAAPRSRLQGDVMVVHAWTAVDESLDRVPLPLIDRYIVSLSREGGVSTGHMALECGPDLYISHHPKNPLTITQQNLLHQVRATGNNDQPGKWMPAYAPEAAATRPSSVRIRFRRFNRDYLQAFWDGYRQDATYNLTHRNCSVVVTEAVDAAVEGLFSHKPFWPALLRLALHPDMWLASSVRVRAESMAWTPGLAMDYVCAIRRLTHLKVDAGRPWWRLWRTRARIGAADKA
ncbi:Uncharacterized membrane protein HdeD, DUF308 family [Polaromonas sp. OV174]|uniref:HdeD family acid-resistance protein n=1 Tax=Polaromonas sp. OV174 TaxID=1855300 RepID=UPI0008F02DE2|nr:DUF308 domain-containing protein [Polaromonas sp. OV174]SFB86170.1 Uncharacterized membrane protein HdeD, DUF308 family [Polaromonas sp. OV174]